MCEPAELPERVRRLPPPLRAEMEKILSVVVGIGVWLALFFAFSLYSWTAIHSGSSDRGTTLFGVSWLVVPVAGGVFGGWWTNRRWRTPPR